MDMEKSTNFTIASDDVDGNMIELADSAPSTSSTSTLMFPMKFDGNLTIGDCIQCTTKAENVILGELLLHNTKTGAILLMEQKPGNGKSSLHFINSSLLKSLKKISPAPRNHQSPLFQLDEDSQVDARLARAEYMKRKLWVDDGLVNEQAKKIFIELKRIFDDVVWDGADILILKCVKVRHPYDITSLESLDSRVSSSNTLTRIKKIIGRQCSPSPSGTAAEPPATFLPERPQCSSLLET